MRPQIKVGEKVWYLRTGSSRKYNALGQIVLYSMYPNIEPSMRIKDDVDGTVRTYAAKDVRSNTGLCGLYNLASTLMMGKECVKWNGAGFDQVTQLIARTYARLNSQSDPVNSDDLITKLLEAAKAARSTSTDDAMKNFIRCLSTMPPDSRYSDLESMAYLVDMHSGRESDRRVDKFMERSGVVKDFVNSDAYTTSEEAVRPRNWVFQ